MEALVNAHVDVVVMDSAHGHSANVLRTRRYGQRQISRICRLLQETLQQETATEALIEAGADAVKVGIGPGSICTTRVVAGIGVPQITAVMDCYEVANRIWNSDYRRWRYQIFRRYDKGNCSRCECMYDGKHLCRM